MNAVSGSSVPDRSSRTEEQAVEFPEFRWRPASTPRGYAFCDFDVLAELDQEFDAIRRSLSSHIYSPKEPDLPVSMREIVTGVVLACRGFPTVDLHFRKALMAGASMGQIVEALEAAVVSTGFPTMLFALPYLNRIRDDLAAGRELLPKAIGEEDT